MCGIAGFFSPIPIPKEKATFILNTMNQYQAHRGPDGNGYWIDDTGRCGLAHTRLSIIDLTQGNQPMVSPSSRNVVTYNGEIYNYRELRDGLGTTDFQTTSDTEVLLKAYEKWGATCLDRFRGMFAFVLWDEARQKLFIARDRFGIKPLYYTIQDGVFYFASEIKTLLPFVQSVETSLEGLQDYLTFQFCLGQKSLFQGIYTLEPAHFGYLGSDLTLQTQKYWEVHYDLDWNHTETYFIEQLRERMVESLDFHLRSDVDVASYVSGGLDSSIVASLAKDITGQENFLAFTGKFSLDPKFDESPYARALADKKQLALHEKDISEDDFIQNIAKVIYHLDTPIAGPGAFPQFMVSQLVQQNGIKVVLGGQGGDEIWGGYTRYLIAYFEQCIKGAIDGTMNNGHYIVTYESIIPNLVSLKQYKPLIQEFWANGIFDERDKRYFQLISRAKKLQNLIQWDLFDQESSFAHFKQIYWGENVGKESYFDSMTHFDFKTLLPALLHVEDRMSMAHSIESRVPFLDHRLVELIATIPSNIKFQNGELKRLLKVCFGNALPDAILNRQDKMGFPVPLNHWITHSPKVRDFVHDIFKSQKAKSRFYLKEGFEIDQLIQQEGEFSRNIWALLSLELWQQTFHDIHTGPLRLDSVDKIPSLAIV